MLRMEEVVIWITLFGHVNNSSKPHTPTIIIHTPSSTQFDTLKYHIIHHNKQIEIIS